MELKTKEDLDSLIENKINESTTIEYKNPVALNDNKEISKDISAMANSDGGFIIYGLCEDDKDHTPTRIEWIKDHQVKEKVEQVLQTRITPKIIDLKIYPILNPEDNKEFVLIVEVPRSEIAPHQDSLDKDNRRYWRRNGYTTRQMEHYEVEDLFFTRKKAILELSLINLNDKPAKYELRMRNKGKFIAEKTWIKLLIPKQLEIIEKNWVKMDEPINNFLPYSIYEYFEDKYPIYPEVSSSIGSIILSKKSKENIIDRIGIGFLIASKNSELRTGLLSWGAYGEGEKITFTKDGKIPLPYAKFPWMD